MGRPGRRKRNNRNSRQTSVRVTRTKGSGPSETTSYRTGGVSVTGMSPTGRVAGSRVTVRATVRDAGNSLTRNDIKLYLDGSEKTRFHYDPGSGSLTFNVGRTLSSGSHEVRIEAEAGSQDRQGRSSSTVRRRWTFTVA